jgi:transcription initiation factor TFIIIB Brf1 subunit/transcription initiation factor TFIIB
VRAALAETRNGETQRLVRAIIVLIRNTTWRCGRLERLIVRNLHKRNSNLGKPGMPINQMIRDFKLTGKKKNEFLDAVRRLERRNIVRILIL